RQAAPKSESGRDPLSGSGRAPEKDRDSGESGEIRRSGTASNNISERRKGDDARSFGRSPSKKNGGISWRCVAISTRHLRLGQAVLPVPGPMHEFNVRIAYGKLKHYADKMFCVTMGVPPRIKLYQQNGHTRRRCIAYISSRHADLHKLEHIMQTKFLGQGSGRAVANQTIGKREHRLTSLICLYR
ncbi:hypothetical protein ALC56_07375, partial [Trachymyrmex septentrionalis]